MNSKKSVPFITLFLTAVVIQHCLACSSTPGRCTQFRGPNSPPPAKQADTQENDFPDEPGVYSVIKFRVSARELTSRPYEKDSRPARPNPYAKVWINGRYEEDCKTSNNQNPNFGKEYSATYNAGDNTYIKVEIWNEDMDSNWIGSTYPVNAVLGHSVFYLKDMTVQGRVLETPLWHNDVGNFYTGTAVVTVSSVQKMKVGENKTEL